MRILYCLLLVLCCGFASWAQQKGLNYQAVIIDPNAIEVPGIPVTGQVLVQGKVWLKFTLKSGSTIDYEELHQTTTDDFGLINLIIGHGTPIKESAKYATFEDIVWDSNVKTLQVGVNFQGGNTFSQMSSQYLNYAAYALYADAVEYKNVRSAPKSLSAFTNDPGYLIQKDLDPLRNNIATNASAIDQQSKQLQINQAQNAAGFLLVNQQISQLQTSTKADSINIVQLNASLALQDQRINSMNSTINDHGNRINSNSSQINYVQNLTTATSNTVNNLVGNFENISNKSSDIQADATSTTKYPTVKSIKDYVDGTLSSGVADANSVTKGKLKLAGDLGGTADLPSVPGLAAKAPINNPSFTGTVSGISKTMVGLSNVDNTSDASKPVSTAVQTALDGKQSMANLSTNIVTDAASLTKYPAVKTIKDYVDAASSTGTPDATITSKGKIKLAGDLAGTADLPTVPDLALKAPINNPTFSGTVGGITKSMVGLSNVDNTSDASKPVSSAVQAALDGKQTLANLSTNMTTDAASLTKYPAVKTIKDYVDATVVSAGSAVPYSGAIQNVNLGNYGLSAATVNSIYVGKGIGSGIENTIVGMNAGNSATTDGVTLLGYRAGYSLNQGRSTMVGDYAGYYLYGGYNVVEGSSAARYQSASTYNTVMGYTAFQGIAGFVNTNYSNYNTAVGAMSMLYHRNGNNNVALGYFSLAGDASTGSSGDANTAIGSGALRLNGAGFNNVALGAYAGYYETGSNTFYVNAYDRSSVIGDQQQSLLYGKFDMTAALQTLRINAAVTIPNTLTVSNTVSGASFVTTSDLRLKTNIQPLGAAMATINQLQPVSYDKKFDLQSSQFSKHEWGFIAQELQKVLPHAVVEGKDEDKILSVDYITLIPLLTKALQEQGQQLKAADERYRALEEKVERLMKLLSK